MGLVPDSKQGKINFYSSKITPWTTNATAIGTTTTAVTALQALVDAATAALATQIANEALFRSSVEAADAAVGSMCQAGADIISSIRTKARTAGDSVYTLAQIPAPATPTPVGAPGMPFDFKVELKPNGTLDLSWKCNNPAGCTNVIYQIYRKVESTGAYEYVGGTGTRSFTDMSVPAGVPSVMYQIQGTRSTGVGDAAEFIVNFGVSSSGSVTATVANATKPAKIAA